jgi:hypothetical protein
MNDLDTVITTTTTNGDTAIGTVATATARAIFPIPFPIPILALKSPSRLQKVEEGLRFIISHFDPTEPLWPRTISTHATGGKQIVVNSFEEAMKWFKAANFLDCRISADPVYSDEYIKRTGIAFVPTLLLCDLDKEHFVTDEEFEAAAAKTCQNFKEILGANPTIMCY